ncbi:MAG: hypothetical protein SFW66_06645 [Gammaproteobacteria bacterium]|nr:hypothetical protein [Gammaproteobacteria bacterium]
MPFEAKYHIESPEEPHKYPLVKMIRAAAENAMVSYTIQNDDKETTYYGRVYIDTFDKQTFKALTPEEIEQVVMVHFHTIQQSNSNPEIELPSQWFFKKTENGFIRFMDCYADVHLSENIIKKTQIAFFFIGTAADPKTRELEEQQAIIENMMTRFNDDLFSQIKTWFTLRKAMKITPPESKIDHSQPMCVML